MTSPTLLSLADRAPRDGDFVVDKGRYGFYVHQVIRVTATFYFYREKSNPGRERRARLDEIVFSGSEDAAEKLAAQLTSSRAQYDHECRTAYERREKRNADLISRARSALEASHEA